MTHIFKLTEKNNKDYVKRKKEEKGKEEIKRYQ